MLLVLFLFNFLSAPCISYWVDTKDFMAEDCILIDHGSKGRCSWLVSPGTVIMEKKRIG